MQELYQVKIGKSEMYGKSDPEFYLVENLLDDDILCVLARFL